MRYAVLGSTALQISVLGFGAAPLGGEYGALTPPEGQRAVHCAIDQGVNLFDVSPYYGRTLAEERLGRALAGKRQGVVLSTKVGRYDRDPPEGFDFSAQRVRGSLEESLMRLRTDVIDILLAHDIEFARREVILNETLPTMRRLKEEGKVRFIGITGYPLELLRDTTLDSDVDVVLSYCHYNLLNTRLDSVLAAGLEGHGVGLISASALHMGALTLQGPPAWHPAPVEVLEGARKGAEWCRSRGQDLAEVALRFAFGNRNVASTLVGMRSEAEVRANVAALEAGEDPETTNAVRNLFAEVEDVEWMSGLPENNDRAILRNPPGGRGAAGSRRASTRGSSR